MRNRFVDVAGLVLAAALISLPAAHAQTPVAPPPHLTVENVRDKVDAFEARVDRLRAVRRGEAIRDLKTIRADLGVLRQRGGATQEELQSLNERLDAWVLKYNLKALPLQT